MFNFWWSARLVDGLEHHLPPLYSHKNQMLIFGLRSTSDDWPGWSMDSNPICHLSAATKMKCSFLDYVQLLMMGWAGRWTQTPSPAKIMKCSFLDYIQLLMISWAGQWTRTLSATCLQPQKWNAHFWIMFNFWWSDGLVDGLKPHLQPLCSQKNEILIFGLRSISDDRPGWLMDLNPIHQPSASKKMKCSFLDYVQLLMIGRAGRCTQIPSATSLQPKIWNAHFKIMFNFWWLAGLVDGLKQHLQLLCSQKNEMLIFGFRSTSDDWTGWSMDSNPICDPSPAIKMKCLFLDYVQLLMIGWAGQWTQAPSPAKIMKCSFLDYIQLLMIGWAGWWTQTPSPAKIMKCSFLDYVQHLMISWAGRWTQTPSATPLQPKTWNTHFWITFNIWWSARLVDGLKPHMPNLISSQNNEMLIFGLHSTSDDQLGWSMDSNPVCHLSPATKMKCSFLDYIQLLMIGWPGQWTRTPSATPLQPQKGNAHFWITFNFWWSAGWSMDLNPIHHPSPATKMKCSFLDYAQLLMIGWAGRWTQTPYATPFQPKKLNAHFWITFNFWWLAGLVDGLKPHLPPFSSQKNEILVIG